MGNPACHCSGAVGQERDPVRVYLEHIRNGFAALIGCGNGYIAGQFSVNRVFHIERIQTVG